MIYLLKFLFFILIYTFCIGYRIYPYPVSYDEAEGEILLQQIRKTGYLGPQSKCPETLCLPEIVSGPCKPVFESEDQCCPVWICEEEPNDIKPHYNLIFDGASKKIIKISTRNDAILPAASDNPSSSPESFSQIDEQKLPSYLNSKKKLPTSGTKNSGQLDESEPTTRKLKEGKSTTSDDDDDTNTDGVTESKSAPKVPPSEGSHPVVLRSQSGLKWDFKRQQPVPNDKNGGVTK